MSRIITLFCLLFLISSVSITEADSGSRIVDYLKAFDLKKPKLLPINNTVYSDSAILVISSQADFDRLQDNLIRLLGVPGRKVTVRIKRGVYYYSNRQIDLDGQDAQGISLSFKGDNAILISRGKRYLAGQKTSSIFSTGFPFIDDRFRFVPIWSEMEQMKNEVELINPDSKLCRVYSTSVLKVSETPQNAYIRITEWYKSAVYPIERISNGYIYFTATDLKRIKNSYNINSDRIVSESYPRFQLCNVPIKNCPVVVNDRGTSFSNEYKSIYECRQGTLVSIKGSSFDELLVSGLRIVGNRSNFNLFDIKDSCFKYGLFIDSNTFESMRGGVISVKSSENVFIQNNVFNYIWGTAIFSDDLSRNVQIIRNSFDNTGWGLMNLPTIVCRSKGYYVAYNKLKDFGSWGIGIGGWYGSGQGMDSFGIIEYNELWHSKDYRSSVFKHGLIDSGAIYCWTNNAEAIIRFNYIHDYCGISSNRGIYCDDGARNVLLYANIILRINSGATIHSRYVPGSIGHFRNNTNNVFAYNVLDGKYVFEGNPFERNCFLGENFLINGNDYLDKCQISNIGEVYPNVNLTIPPDRESDDGLKHLFLLIETHPYSSQLAFFQKQLLN